MALENLTVSLINLTNGAPIEDVARQLSFLTRLFQALGGLIILYLIFNVINAIMNKKKNREIKNINKNLEEIKRLLSSKSGRKKKL